MAALEADEGLELAGKAINQIRESATQCKSEFIELARNVGIETYSTPLSKARVWDDCASEWGQGLGFKNRVVAHLEKWFNENEELKQALEKSVVNYFERSVIASLRQLTAENKRAPISNK